MEELYADGGCIGPNPSPLGGTWAWVRTRDDAPIQAASGVLLPSDLHATQVSNNNSELYALLVALLTLPEGWDGRVNSDSQTALGWVFKGWKQDKIPPCLRDVLNALITSGKLLFLDSRLLQGHPTKEDLRKGVGAKRGLPVSIHNVACDAMCNEEAAGFKARMQKPVALHAPPALEPGYPLRDRFNALAEELRLPVSLAREQYGLSCSDDYPRVLAAMEEDLRKAAR